MPVVVRFTAASNQYSNKTNLIPKVIMLRMDTQLQNIVESFQDGLENSHDIYSQVKVVSANDNNNEPCFYCKSYTCANCLELEDVGN